ncbi:hypothetical protein [Cryptosporangium minutisporangium]|uniref:Cyclic nucleotide-binding domain-containing protein n=1 Tax=Cryptosporangium minutisporangium TaxID=113569 RepID=A0ABP6SWP5_9ACTN
MNHPLTEPVLAADTADAAGTDRAGTEVLVLAQPYLGPATLRDLSLRPGQAVFLLEHGLAREALILAVAEGEDAVTAFLDGRVRAVPGHVRAVQITDPRIILALTLRALGQLLPAHQAAGERIDELAAQLARLRDDRDTQLSEIRAYAVTVHQRGEVCRAGLNDFLDRFGLGRYQPRHVVTFTITGGFEVTPGTERSSWLTEQDVLAHLLVDTGGIDGVLDGTVDFQVTVSASESDQE